MSYMNVGLSACDAVLPGSLPERAGYRMAQNAGYAVTETRFGALNQRADALIQALIDMIE